MADGVQFVYVKFKKVNIETKYQVKLITRHYKFSL